MDFKDLLVLTSKKKSKKESVSDVKKLALGMGIAAAIGVAAGILFAPKSGKETRKALVKKTVNSVEKVNDSIQEQADIVKDSAAAATKEICDGIKDVNGKAESIKKVIKGGSHQISKSIHKTSKSISKELDKPIKL